MLSESVTNNEKLPARIRLYRRILATFGWTLVINIPSENKYLVVCAPHTSLWDYPLFLSAMFAIGKKCRWLGQSQLLEGLIGPLARLCGGFKLENDPKTSFVDKLSREFKQSESLVLCLTPEGSSSFVPRWRTGFYYISLKAGVPIVLGFIDYKNKTLGLGDYFTPTGNIEMDLRFIRNFYRTVTPKNPDRAGLIKL